VATPGGARRPARRGAPAPGEGRKNRGRGPWGVLNRNQGPAAEIDPREASRGLHAKPERVNGTRTRWGAIIQRAVAGVTGGEGLCDGGGRPARRPPQPRRYSLSGPWDLGGRKAAAIARPQRRRGQQTRARSGGDDGLRARRDEPRRTSAHAGPNDQARTRKKETAPGTGKRPRAPRPCTRSTPFPAAPEPPLPANPQAEPHVAARLPRPPPAFSTAILIR
jgi:hypothetical protein